MKNSRDSQKKKESDFKSKQLEEEKILHAARLWQTTFDSIPAMISIQDKNFRLINVNKTYEQKFNVSHNELAGKKCYEIVHHSSCPVNDCPNKKTLETKQIVKAEIFEPTLDAHFEVMTSPIFDINGELLGSVHVAKDITVEKEIQVAHRESEELLRKIAENIPNSYLSIIEKDFTVSFSSGQEFKKQNLDPESFTGLTVKEIFGDKSKLVMEEYKKTFTGEERSFELFINNQYQHYRTVPLVSENGLINRILSVVENITERKLAEKRHQEYEEQFRILTEAMPQIVWSTDNNGNVNYYNGKAYKFHGISKGEIEKLNWEKIIHPDDYHESISKWNEAKISGGIFSIEHRLKRSDGEYRWHLTRSVPVTDSSGKILQWIGTATDIHEQKSHEEILERRVNEQILEIKIANEYNRSLFEASLDALVTIGPDGKITDANKAAELIRGLERSDLIGTDFSSYYTDPERAREAYLKTFSEGSIKDYPLTLKHSSGKTVYVLYNASIYKNELGQVEGVLASARDITDIKKAEMNIRSQADRHNAMLSTMPDGFWIVDSNAKMIDVNDNYLKMSGYSREEFLRLSVPDIEVMETAADTAKHMKEIHPSGFDRFETKHRRKDGSVFDVEVSASYLKTPDQFITFIRDITKRKQMDEKLESERKRFYDVLEMLPAFVVLFTSDYYVRHANRFFINRFGEDKSKRCFELLNNRTEPCENCMTYKVLQNNQHLEWEWIGPDGRNYYIYDYPFKDVDGTDLILKMGIDVTEMKQAEQEIIKLNEELEKRVQQRTAELVLANQELEAFSYSVSHDLRTPLSAVDGFSKILQRDISDKLTDEYRDYLNRIISASDKMSNLITGLLNLSRISGVELKIKDVRIDLIATEIIINLKKLEPSRNVDVSVQPDLHVNADSEFLTIVMENLINNAWKFSRFEKKIKIKIGMKNRNGEKIYYVKDNGIGFDVKDAEKLFTPFQRFHDRKKFEGSGIGLATVKRIIAKHGGKIWAESELNKGTTFYFKIPY